MSKSRSLPPITGLGSIALFLDLDGTIVEITELPQQVRLEPATIELLARLARRLDGALAIVSGRSLADIDRLFAPLVLPAAGVHGLMRRDATGRLHAGPLDTGAIQPVTEVLKRALPALLIEEKPGAVAVHYRTRPELTQACYAAVRDVVEGRDDLEIVHGKMVYEVKLKGASKGTAIGAFMAEPPFVGRLPVFAGDDVTDEDGFAVVEAMGGYSIKVGNGLTKARWTIATTAEFIDWLASLANRSA
ncbi:MAG TPA: trehalose-phosphatase [Hyphomicrobiaceae bacterium]|nr:trehalose-phosphatase [Hyphomicrobiaceae bacterium]